MNEGMNLLSSTHGSVKTKLISPTVDVAEHHDVAVVRTPDKSGQWGGGSSNLTRTLPHPPFDSEFEPELRLGLFFMT